MPEIAMALPIPPEKLPRVHEAIESFTGDRRAEFDASRRRMGLVRERIWLQQTPQGPVQVMLLDATDPAAMMEQMATSQDPFDVEFRAFLLDVYGIDLTEPQSALPQLVMDWKRTAASAPA